MRVILAEDSVLFRQGLARLLEESGITVVDEVGTAEDLLNRVSISNPDVAIIDIRMPPTHTTEGIDAAIRLRSLHPEVKALVLSQYVETEYAVALLEDVADGGVGYLLKDRVTDPAQLIDAIKRVAAGETVVDPQVVKRLVERRRRNSPIDTLTVREREVLSAMAAGASNNAVSETLFMSTKTVETHVRSIFQKLGLQPDDHNHRRVLAVVTWLREQ